MHKRSIAMLLVISLLINILILGTSVEALTDKTAYYRATIDVYLRPYAPGYTYGPIATISKGTEIVVTDYSEVDGDIWGLTTYKGKNGWTCLKFYEYISGYVYGTQNEDEVEPTEVPTTEIPTVPPSTEPPTFSSEATEASTESPTYAPTYPSTEAPAEMPTEMPTEAPVSKSGKTGCCTWTLKGTKLTISGKGEMADYPDGWYDWEYASPPWGRSITDLIIEDGVTRIGDCAFYWCKLLKNVTIPDSVTSIGWESFEGTQWYEEQPDGLIYAGKVAYKLKGNNYPSSIELKAGTLGVAGMAFFKRTELESIIIPNSVIDIGYDAFYRCNGLTSISIPSSVKNIRKRAFCSCQRLSSITVSVGNTVYDSRNNCNAIINSSTNELLLGCKRTVIPDSVTGIGDSAFAGCTGMYSLFIPSSVTSIHFNSVGYYETEYYFGPMTSPGIQKAHGFVLYGSFGSIAQQYAEENGFTFIEASEPPAEPPTNPSEEPTDPYQPTEPTEPSNAVDHAIYFDASSAGWNNCNVMFYIYDAYGNAYNIWGNKSSRGYELGNGLWRYDLEEHGIDLSPYNQYTVIFNNDLGAQIYPLNLGIENYGQTAVCNGEKKPNPADKNKLLPVAVWNRPYTPIETFEGKNIIYLDTTAVSELLDNNSTLSCSMFDKEYTVSQVDKNIWVVDFDNVIQVYDSTSDGSYHIASGLTGINIFGSICSYPCYFDDTCYGDTLVFDGNSVSYKDYWGDSNNEYFCHWKDHDNSIYGAVTGFDENYDLIGETTLNFDQRISLLREYIEYRLPVIRPTTIDTDQYLIDEMAAQLGMKKSDVACMIENTEIWNPDDSELPDGYSYDIGSYYLKKSGSDKPEGYHRFSKDGYSGMYALYYRKPSTISFGSSYSGSSGSSFGSSSSSGGSSTQPAHTFTPFDKFVVVRYDGEDVFTTVSKNSLTPYQGDLFYYNPADPYVFGYNTSAEIGNNSSGSGGSSSSSNNYPLATPRINSVTNNSDGIMVKWGAVDGAVKYRVFVKGESNWIKISDTTDTSLLYTEAKSGNAYTFTVRCISADGSEYLSDYNDNINGSTCRRIDTPIVVRLQSLEEGNKITWEPVSGVARYRVSVKSRNSWKMLGETFDTSFIHSSQGEGSIFAQPGVEYTYTVTCVSYTGYAVISDYNHSGWSITYTGDGTVVEERHIIGDADCDGEITILDATAIQRHLASLETKAFDELAADADGDGEVTILDATAIQRWLAGLPSHEGIGKPIENST